MKRQIDTTRVSEGRPRSAGLRGSGSESAIRHADKRPGSVAQQRLSEMANDSAHIVQQHAFQRMANERVDGRHAAQLEAMASENRTGLPDALKAGIERLSGYALDDVRVHYNSASPALLRANAYAQGTDIHLASGQERHLAHEAWHVVQQKQGRVKPTVQMKTGELVNDDDGLEAEADVMGRHAVQLAAACSQERPEHFRNYSASHARPVFQLAKGDYDPDADNAEKIAARQKEGLPGLELSDALIKKKWRKVNRLAGEFDRKKAYLEPLIPGMLDRLRSLLQTLKDEPAAPAASKEKSLGLMTFVVAGLDKLPARDLTWHEFDTLSMLGPLLHWLNDGMDDDSKDASAAYPASVNATLKKLRRQQAERVGPSVVAHRGAGPTNRTRGGLITQTDPRRTSRPAENSEEAFESALSQTTGVIPVGLDGVHPLGLDGVECDVFLSSDGVPILSHEGAVMEQLSTARQGIHAAFAGRPHVEDSTRDELVAVQRTESAKSRFMDLPRFLDMTVDTASKYHSVTGKPFRIEIEMKGKPHESADPPVDSIKHPDRYRALLPQQVAKAISKFKKTHPDVPTEIIIFNNSAEDSASYGMVRSTKSRLGGLYTGLGSPDADLGRSAGVDELRMPVSAKNARAIGHPNYEEFILTLVPGSERDLTLEKTEGVNRFEALDFKPDVTDLEKLLVSPMKKRADLQQTVALFTSALEQRIAELTRQLALIEKSLDELLAPPRASAATSKKGSKPLVAISPQDEEKRKHQLDEDGQQIKAELVKLEGELAEAKKPVQSEIDQIAALTGEITPVQKQIDYIKLVNSQMLKPGADVKEIKAILKAIAEKDAKNVHLLTDTPRNAAIYKQPPS
ncbi:eCIS core domain-containing protein [Massilia aurea]|uniref:eCIS core domain-containing protein n=1 Tax=Massilia aurea TaxID=373040 RepID=UPI000F2DDBBE|nr:DUF4157 domain-containing protein [Massilia aurea]